MKKILSVSLALVMLVCLCLSVTSCGQETSFDKYATYLDGLEGKKDTVKADGLTTVTAQTVVMGEDETKNIVFKSAVQATDATVSVSLYLTDNSSTYRFHYDAVSVTTGQTLLHAEGNVAALSYTGDETVAFDVYEDYMYNSGYYEFTYSITATGLLKALVLQMKPMMAKANVDVKDFYFISIDFPEAEGDAADTQENLGGALSKERWIYVGQMLVLGMGMVFLVLVILWLILLIFAKVFGEKNKEKVIEEPKPEVAPVPAVEEPVSPPTDDAAVVAAITAAVAAMIQSDEGLSQEFAGGFRVVSFRKKSGKGAWNA